MKKAIVLLLLLFMSFPIFAFNNLIYIEAMGGLNTNFSVWPLSWGANVGWIGSWGRDSFSLGGLGIESSYKQFKIDNKMMNIYGFGISAQFTSTNESGTLGNNLMTATPYIPLNIKALVTDNGDWGLSSSLLRYNRLIYINDFGFKIGTGIDMDFLFNHGPWFSLYITIGGLFNPNRQKMERQYKLSQQQQAEEEAEEVRQRQAEQIRAKVDAEKAYTDALQMNGVTPIVLYIQSYKNRAYFNNDSYTEIARRLSNNNNIHLIELDSGRGADIANPYNFSKTALYYCKGFTVQQWIDTNFLADVSLGQGSSGDTRIYINHVYDVSSIGRNVTNTYLRYVGTQTYTAVSGAVTTVPAFDLLFSF
jgi:hypothetical protein